MARRLRTSIRPGAAARRAPRRFQLRPLLLLGALAVAGGLLQGAAFVGQRFCGGLAVARPRPSAWRNLDPRLDDGLALWARGGAEEEYAYTPATYSRATLKVGQELEGIVTSIAPFGAFVDYGDVQEGLVPLGFMKETGRVSKAQEVVKVGDAVRCWVLQVSADKLTLSLVKSKVRGGGGGRPSSANFKVEEFAGVEGWIDAEVVNTQAFGAFVQVKSPSGEEGQGLVHISEMGEGRVTDVTDVVNNGDKVKVRVLNVNNGKLALSMKKGFDYEAFANVRKEDYISGRIAGVQDYGIFVEIKVGEAVAQGLVPASVMAEERPENVRSVASIGDEVKVRIANVDKETEKITLSMIDRDPPAAGGGGPAPSSAQVDLTPFTDFDTSKYIDGLVTGTAEFGAFVEVPVPQSEDKFQGLVPISLMEESRSGRKAQEIVNIGQKVQVRVVSVDVGARRLQLSMIDRDGAPRVNSMEDMLLFKNVDESTWMTGRVESVVNYGMFVSVKPPGAEEDREGQGLLHTSGMSNDKALSQYSVGDEVQVRLTNVESGKVAFTMLAEGEAPVQRSAPPGGNTEAGVAAMQAAGNSVWLDATVTSVTNYGAFMELTAPGSSETVSGLLHNSQMSEKGLSAEEVNKIAAVGSTLQVRIYEVDTEAKKVSFSIIKDTDQKQDLASLKDIPDTEQLSGTVTELLNEAALVSVKTPSGDLVEGTVDISEMGEGDEVEDPSEVVEVGMDVQVRVLRVDTASGKMELTMKMPAPA